MRSEQQQQQLQLDLEQLQQVLTPPIQALPDYTSSDDRLPADMDVASAFRDEVQSRAPAADKVCAVCARQLPLLQTN